MRNEANDQIYFICFINSWGYSIGLTNEEINSEHSIMTIPMTEQKGENIKNGRGFFREWRLVFKNIYLTDTAHSLNPHKFWFI